MRKKSKLPDNLYHFTSLIKYRIILESGKLALTPSNLKFDPDTFHYEPIYFREQEIGMQAVDKYKDHHPVVWLTANDQVTAQNTGLSDDKLMCRFRSQGPFVSKPLGSPTKIWVSRSWGLPRSTPPVSKWYRHYGTL